MGENKFEPVKSNIDKDFDLSAKKAGQELVGYTVLVRLLNDKRELLEMAEKKLRDEQKSDAHPDKTAHLIDLVDMLKREIYKLDHMKKTTSRDIEKVVKDPRWHELFFDAGIDVPSPSKKNN